MLESRSMRGLVLFLASLMLLLVASGCATRGGEEEGAQAPTGPSVLTNGRTVGTIRVAPGALEEDVLGVIEQFSVVPTLESDVRIALGSKASPSGPVSVDIEIVGMRVRSTGSAIWWGVMAGVDTITVDVTVREGGRTLKTFQTGTSTMLGGFAFGGRGVRINRMLDTLGKRVAEGI